MADTSPGPKSSKPDSEEVAESQIVAIDEGELEEDSSVRSALLAAPAWMVSLMVHIVILVLLGLVTVADPVKIVNVLTATSTDDDGPEIEEFTIEDIDPGEVSEMEEEFEPLDEIVEQFEMTEPIEVADVQIEQVALDMSDMASALAPQTSALKTLTSASMAPLNSRAIEMKKKLLREYGGTDSSEAAVTEALKWIARHQMPNGGWTFQHTIVCNVQCDHPGDQQRMKSFNAATAMALLPMLGAGQTHLEGDFKQTVHKGLRFLVQNGRPVSKGGLRMLDYTESGGNLYSHGLAAIALCEAYAMTEDPDLAAAAQGAINYIVYAQARDGGWRYKPHQDGDTSVTGWQIMALKSGYMGHLNIPGRTFAGSVMFLDKVGSNEGSTYGYVEKSANFRPTTSAIGLLCRMYSGWKKDHPGIIKGVDQLAKTGVDKKDIYYNYYAAQVLRQFGGPKWEKFNNELRDWLVQVQSQNGYAKGSWYFKDSKSHRGPEEGGRLAATSFATMILEVYYRHMPLYADAATEDDFPL
ncbi:MAG: prenyltransferase/squalene oxidase repeat-containing protein [Planctomycetota bacterium]